jgi:hypothetical protein
MRNELGLVYTGKKESDSLMGLEFYIWLYATVLNEESSKKYKFIGLRTKLI